jgi:hypothetical protein
MSLRDYIPLLGNGGSDEAEDEDIHYHDWEESDRFGDKAPVFQSTTTPTPPPGAMVHSSGHLIIPVVETVVYECECGATDSWAEYTEDLAIEIGYTIEPGMDLDEVLPDANDDPGEILVNESEESEVV